MQPETPPPGRRIVALVLPELLCELSGPASRAPFGVVMAPGPGARSPAGLEPRSSLAAVNETARASGLRPGQTLAEATALVARLEVRELSEQQVQAALERIAESSFGFGQPVSWRAPDTVWVDVTGSTHLWGDELSLSQALLEQVRGWGHRVRLAIAAGPVLAQAFARWGPLSRQGVCLVPSADTRQRLEQLPLLALPLPAETIEWFARLGILSVGQLRELPPKSSAPRLGKAARLVRALCEGRDDTPLVAYEPPPVVVEEVHWEDAVSGLEPLMFALRGLVARTSARLEGRGQAAQQLLLELEHDPGIARQRGVASRGSTWSFALSAPLWRETELERVLRSRLERASLAAPTVSMRLTVPALTDARARQLKLGRQFFSVEAARWGSQESSAEALSVLLAELSADVGPERVGRLRWVNHHRPESSSVLEPLRSLDVEAARARPTLLPQARSGLDVVTRLLPQPIPLAAPLRVGELVGLGQGVYSIERVRFVQRLEEVEWWTPQPASRDYLRLWLAGPRGGLEALVFVDRATGKRYLQALWD